MAFKYSLAMDFERKNNVLNAMLAHVLNDLAADLIHLLALLKVDDF